MKDKHGREKQIAQFIIRFIIQVIRIVNIPLEYELSYKHMKVSQSNWREFGPVEFLPSGRLIRTVGMVEGGSASDAGDGYRKNPAFPGHFPENKSGANEFSTTHKNANPPGRARPESVRIN